MDLESEINRLQLELAAQRQRSNDKFYSQVHELTYGHYSKLTSPVASQVLLHKSQVKNKQQMQKHKSQCSI